MICTEPAECVHPAFSPTAVRLLEEMCPVDAAAAAAAAAASVEGLDQDEWQLEEMQRRKEEQEAEASEDDEAPLVSVGWKV